MNASKFGNFDENFQKKIYNRIFGVVQNTLTTDQKVEVRSPQQSKIYFSELK